MQFLSSIFFQNLTISHVLLFAGNAACVSDITLGHNILCCSYGTAAAGEFRSEKRKSTVLNKQLPFLLVIVQNTPDTMFDTNIKECKAPTIIRERQDYKELAEYLHMTCA